MAVPAGRSVKFCRRANESSQRAGGHDRRRSQINERIAIAHAAFEIAIGRADRGFAFLHQTATQSDARAATRRQRNCAGVHAKFANRHLIPTRACTSALAGAR